ncbi:MAG: NAD(P)-dependent oxidoreductase [Pseudomonadota bacterium]
MTILLSTKLSDWMTNDALRDVLKPLLPDTPIVCREETVAADAVRMLVVDRLDPGEAAGYPNLQVIQKLGAGVETIVRQQDLPDGVRIARLKPKAAADEMTRYALAHVLDDQLNLAHYRADQPAHRWHPRAPRKMAETVIGVLGLGHIGGSIATAFSSLGFRVIGYSRSPRPTGPVECHTGEDGLRTVLAESDYLIAVLPSTEATRGLMNAERFSQMKPGAHFMNIGRGDLVDDDALLDAVDRFHLAGAVLDVFHVEPLPADHAFWTHNRIRITPHISGWHVDDGLQDVAENYRRLEAGETLINEISVALGY